MKKIFTGRRMGVFLFVMAGVAIIDWILATAVFRGPPAIVDLIFYGQLFNDFHPPLPAGLLRLPCPGNGFAFFCGPWALLLIIAFAFAAGVGLYVNARRTLAVVLLQGWVGSLDRRWLRINLTFVASVLAAFGYVWGWAQYFGLLGQVLGITTVYQVAAPFIHLLFILVSLAAGRHLRRSGQTV